MALLVGVHRLLGHPGQRRSPGLDLDEHESLAIHRDQVDLDARAAKIALQYPVAAAAQMTLRDPFTPASQRDPIQTGKRTPPEVA